MANPEDVSTEDPKPTLQAGTIAQTLEANRINRGEPQQPRPPAGKQITTRKTQPHLGPTASPGPRSINSNRHIQQGGEEPGSAEGEDEEGDTGSDELKKAHAAMKSHLFGVPIPPPKSDERKEEEEGEGAVPPPDKGKKEKSEDGQRTAPRVIKAPPPMSAQDIARIADEVVTRRAAAPAEPKPSEKQEDDLAWMDASDRRSIEIAAHMAKQNPEKYKGLPRDLTEMARRKQEYRDAWIKENKGEKFSWEDAAHVDFLANVTPEFNADDFEDARIELRAEAIAEQKMQGTQERIRELERSQVESSLRDAVAEESTEQLKAFQSEFAPEADWDLTTKPGREAIKQSEKVVGETVLKHAFLLERAVGEIVKIFESNGKYRINPKNELHAFISKAVNDFEVDFSKKPPEEMMSDDGRLFATRDDYIAMTPVEQSRHWIIGKKHAIWIMRQTLLSAAKRERDMEVARIQHLAKANNWTFNPESIVALRKASAGKQSKKPKLQETARQEEPEPPPPAATTGAKTDTGNESRRKANADFTSNMMNALFSRQPDKS